MTDERDSAGRWRKGRSGNPAGKPVSSAKYRAMLADLADDAIRVLRESLAGGDTAAALGVGPLNDWEAEVPEMYDRSDKRGLLSLLSQLCGKSETEKRFI